MSEYNYKCCFEANGKCLDEAQDCDRCMKKERWRKRQEATGQRLVAGYVVKTKSKATASGWVQYYVSLKIEGMEFKRKYHSKLGAIKAADKLKKILGLETT